MEPMSTPTGTQAVDRAARLLTEIVDATDALTFSELASRTGLAKSTTSRLLLALERSNLVRREKSGTYGPGDVFVRYAWGRRREDDLVKVSEPYLEKLGALTGETVNLGVERGGRVDQIAQVDSRYVLGATNWIGRPVPLHATALGKALLAFEGGEVPAGKLERCTARTITSRASLSEELASVRRLGFAVTDEELEQGLVAVAAPVFREGDKAVAAISVTGPAGRLGAARLADIAGECIREAALLSRALGHRSEREGAA